MLKCDFNKVTYIFIEITLRHGSSPVNLLYIFRKLFPKNTSGELYLVQLLLIFRKLDIQTFNSKQICSLNQYCWQAIFHE